MCLHACDIKFDKESSLFCLNAFLCAFVVNDPQIKNTVYYSNDDDFS